MEKAAELQAELTEAGTPLSTPDIFIASSAIVNEFILVTNNEGHFKRIDSLSMENWITQNISFV